jgi:hypothetical protein
LIVIARRQGDKVKEDIGRKGERKGEAVNGNRGDWFAAQVSYLTAPVVEK